jgi:DNA-binding LacI/PurR family transcriptional regulator
MSIDLKNPTPIYKQIADDIRSQIASGKMKVGDEIGSHQELALRYDVSLITIRKAREILINEGILYTRVGKGTYVAKNSGLSILSKQKMIGFVLRDLESQFFSRILYSVEKKISRKGYNLLVSSSANRIQREEDQIKHFLKLGVDGLIIVSLSSHYHAPPIIKKLERDRFPYVVVSYVVDKNICHVGTDQIKGGYIAGEYLINLGHIKIGFINSQHGSLLGEARKRGLILVHEKYGIEFNDKFVYELERSGEYYDYSSGYQIGLNFAKANDRPEAIFAYNDLSAIGFEKGVLDQGLKVPQDVSIIGFDNIKRCITAPVQLTTIHQPIDKIGMLSVETLLKKIQGQKVKCRQILKPKLVVRESCQAKNLSAVNTRIKKKEIKTEHKINV